jgi:hypothetical protein
VIIEVDYPFPYFAGPFIAALSACKFDQLGVTSDDATRLVARSEAAQSDENKAERLGHNSTTSDERRVMRDENRETRSERNGPTWPTAKTERATESMPPH